MRSLARLGSGRQDVLGRWPWASAAQRSWAGGAGMATGHCGTLTDLTWGIRGRGPPALFPTRVWSKGIDCDNVESIIWKNQLAFISVPRENEGSWWLEKYWCRENQTACLKGKLRPWDRKRAESFSHHPAAWCLDLGMGRQSPREGRALLKSGSQLGTNSRLKARSLETSWRDRAHFRHQSPRPGSGSSTKWGTPERQPAGSPWGCVLVPCKRRLGLRGWGRSKDVDSAKVQRWPN